MLLSGRFSSKLRALPCLAEACSAPFTSPVACPHGHLHASANQQHETHSSHSIWSHAWPGHATGRSFASSTEVRLLAATTLVQLLHQEGDFILSHVLVWMSLVPPVTPLDRLSSEWHGARGEDCGVTVTRVRPCMSRVSILYHCHSLSHSPGPLRADTRCQGCLPCHLWPAVSRACCSLLMSQSLPRRTA